MATLDIIIVNWNAGGQLRQCLDSIAATEQNFLSRVVVVDNASTDGSVDGLADLALPVQVICNSSNRGFGAACNQGAAGSRADYLLFLNPDTQLFSDSLARPVDYLEQSDAQQVGVIGVQLVDHEHRVQRTCARFPTLGMFLVRCTGCDRRWPRACSSYMMNDWDHQDSRVVDHVMGAFFLVRQTVFEQLGGFDESFFLYLEDLDFSYRLRQAGWYSFYFTGAQVYHKGGGTSEQIKGKRLAYAWRSRIRYGYRYFSWAAATVLTVATLVIEPVCRVVLALSRRSPQAIAQTIKGMLYLWASLLKRDHPPAWSKPDQRL